MSKIILAEQASAPDTPGSGKAAVYVDANGVLAVKDDAGNVTKIGRGEVLTAAGMKPTADSTTAIQLTNAAGTAVLTVDTTNSRVIPAALAIGVAASLLQRPQAGVVRQQLETVSVADNGTLTIASNAARGFLIVYNATDGTVAVAVASGGAGVTLLHNGGSFSTTAGTASNVNLYTSSSNIVVENKRGGARSISVWLLL